MAEQGVGGALDELLEGPIPTRVAKVLEAAEVNGWEHNFTSLATRWYPNGEDKYGKPWFALWHLNYWPEKERWSWRFAHAMASNGQRLKMNDVFTYLEHPEVIYPEPPAQTQAEKLNKIMSEGGKWTRST